MHALLALAPGPERRQALGQRCSIGHSIADREPVAVRGPGPERRAASCHRSAARLETSCGPMTRCSSFLPPSDQTEAMLSTIDSAHNAESTAESMASVWSPGQSTSCKGAARSGARLAFKARRAPDRALALWPYGQREQALSAIDELH